MAKSSADDSAPLTKGDLKTLLVQMKQETTEEIRRYIDAKLDEKTGETHRYIDDKLAAQTEDTHRYIDDKLAAQKEETHHFFKVYTEQLVRDFQGAFKDRTVQHTDHIADLRRRTDRIERHLNLLPIG